MSDNTARNKVSSYAQEIEKIAREIQSVIANGNSPLALANELVRSSSTFTFVLGEMYALDTKGQTATILSNPQSTPVRKVPNYHNLRDSFGRFRKV